MYLPTILETNNCTANFGADIIYQDNGGLVTGTGDIIVTPTGTGNTSVKFTAPTTLDSQLVLGFGSSLSGLGCKIQATVVGTEVALELYFDAPNTNEQRFGFTFSYQEP